MRDFEIPFAPWHKPRRRHIGHGVYVTTVYGSHILAALIHWPFASRARRLSAQPPASQGGDE